MPVTARLSKLFYDRLGEEVANELVDWFNAVDATYRGDLERLNELNYARFESKLEQRITEVLARIDRLEATFDLKLERRLGDHTRWFIAAWAVQLAAIIGLWFRH